MKLIVLLLCLGILLTACGATPIPESEVFPPYCGRFLMMIDEHTLYINHGLTPQKVAFDVAPVLSRGDVICWKVVEGKIVVSKLAQ